MLGLQSNKRIRSVIHMFAEPAKEGKNDKRHDIPNSCRALLA